MSLWCQTTVFQAERKLLEIPAVQELFVILVIRHRMFWESVYTVAIASDNKGYTMVNIINSEKKETKKLSPNFQLQSTQATTSGPIGSWLLRANAL